jgi:DENN (AEX-3) domain
MEWVAPLIPMLPDKLIDMIESPVPLIAGVVIHDLGRDKVKDGQHITKILEKSV